MVKIPIGASVSTVFSHPPEIMPTDSPWEKESRAVVPRTTDSCCTSKCFVRFVEWSDDVVGPTELAEVDLDGCPGGLGRLDEDEPVPVGDDQRAVQWSITMGNLSEPVCIRNAQAAPAVHGVD